MIGSIGRILGAGLDVGRSIFGGNQTPAVETPIITNISTTNETRDSGASNDRPMMQANPFAMFTPQVVQGISRNLPSISRALGIGGGVALGSQFFGGSGEVCEAKPGKAFNVSRETGCISVTRKQQQALKDALKVPGVDIPTLAASIGLDPMVLVQLLLKKFKARGRGITPASMRTTKRTIRQIKTLHNEVASMASRKTPVRRRSGAISQVNLRGSSS